MTIKDARTDDKDDEEENQEENKEEHAHSSSGSGEDDENGAYGLEEVLNADEYLTAHESRTTNLAWNGH